MSLEQEFQRLEDQLDDAADLAAEQEARSAGSPKKLSA